VEVGSARVGHSFKRQQINKKKKQDGKGKKGRGAGIKDKERKPGQPHHNE